MQAYVDAILAIIREPTSNLTAAVLLVAAIVLIALILIVAVLMLLVPPSTAPGRTAPSNTMKSRLRERKRRLVPRWVVTTALGLMLVVAGAYTYYVSSSNQFCSESCHSMEPSAASWAASSHSGVACVRCHEGRMGAASLPAAAAARVRYLVAAQLGRSPQGAVVSTRRCLECHREIREDSVESTVGIRVSHKEPVDAGIPCAACHTDIGHAAGSGSRASVMQRCLACHDGKKAPTECETCHLGDPGDAPVADRIYQKTELPPPGCGGCHDQTACDECHGLRMPHTVAFVNGDHAMAAAFDRKQLCYRCHAKSDCGRCHQDFTIAHGPSFEARHKESGWGQPCNTCHNKHEGSFCARCHGPGK